ncbi:MAG: hypothetical protein JNM51_16625 [Bacteroidia bacterium]|nr:hypothetical protein [Bacteroidia bacterium]
MKEKLENISKLVPALTLLCYISGFVIYNTHLAQFGIIDVEIFNLRYIVAGLNFLFFSAFILGTVYLWPLEFYKTLLRKLFWIALNTTIAFTLYIIFFYPLNTNVKIFQSYAILIAMTLLIHICVESIKKNGFRLSDAPFWIFSLGMGSLFLFGLSFKQIKMNIGGGQLYRKVLILEGPVKGLINVDNNFMTDTLYIIHENEKQIYFYNYGKVCCIKKDKVVGEIIVSE